MLPYFRHLYHSSTEEGIREVTPENLDVDFDVELLGLKWYPMYTAARYTSRTASGSPGMLTVAVCWKDRPVDLRGKS